MKKDALLQSTIDPSEHGDFSSSVMNTIKRALVGVDGMLPAQIVAYSKSTNTATVKVLMDMITSDGGTLARPILHNIPVYRHGGGGFMICVDLKSGDTGWIKANDRDITGFLSSLGQSKPNSLRVKNFSDGVFFPDTVSKGSMKDGSLTIQSLTGETLISLSDSSIKLKVGGTILEIDESGVNITASSVKNNGVEIGATHTNGGQHIP